MNGYLVVLRHSEDDIPVRLFGNRTEAIKFAESVTEDCDYDSQVVLRIDASTPICVCVYGFAEDGRLTSLEVVKDFDVVESTQTE